VDSEGLTTLVKSKERSLQPPGPHAFTPCRPRDAALSKS